MQVANVNDIQEYFSGVMRRANHHAEKVNAIILALVGGVVWRTSGNFRVREYDGAPANMLWMEVGKTTYCFLFNHTSGEIEVHKGSSKGPLLRTFNNQTPLEEVKTFFEGL